MKALMFGWEFPPFKSGGWGTACRDLCKGLHKNDVEVTFVMPQARGSTETDFGKVLGTKELPFVKIHSVSSVLQPYATPVDYVEMLTETEQTEASGEQVYGKNLFEEVERYAQEASRVADKEAHDVIHAKDWMTYKAGIIARNKSGKPLVVHIHATEEDRTAGNPNHWISEREKEGLEQADLVIANSEWTKKKIMDAYGISEEKVRVVHWGIEFDEQIREEEYRTPLTDYTR